MIEPDAVEIRVLGCLLEKQRTTPDQYPLTLNSLRLACNQSTARDPVVDFDEHGVRDALTRLAEKRWARAASGAGSRAAKFRQLYDEAHGLDEAEVAVLTVLMLRGPQTAGELKGRTERMHSFSDLDEVLSVLARLAERGTVERLPRRPGEKGERWRQIVGGAEEPSTTPPARELSPILSTPRTGSDSVRELEERVARLEAELAALRAEVRGGSGRS